MKRHGHGARGMKKEHIPRGARVVRSLYNVLLGHRAHHVGDLRRMRKGEGVRIYVPGARVVEFQGARLDEGTLTRPSGLR